MLATIKSLDQLSITAEELFRTSPPEILNPNKQLVYRIACPPGTTGKGGIEYSRWPSMAPPEGYTEFNPETFVEGRPGFYDYSKPLAHAVDWHVNFADPHLFYPYDGPRMAQDEMMVAEHPILAALVEGLHLRGMEARTVGTDNDPTAVLVAGAERRCAIDTLPNEREGRPEGLYGNRFTVAPADAVKRAVRAINPPTISNIIAIAAPPCGVGVYTRESLTAILLTAHTGFRAAVMETGRLFSPKVPVVIHTGFWGCGALGGNRELMALLQIFAAHLAEVDHMVFHAADLAGVEILERSLRQLREFLAASNYRTDQFLTSVHDYGYRWGVGDGN